MNSPRFFSARKKGIVNCRLCPGNCALPPGGKGRCGVRVNRAGKAEIPFYGFVTGLALDPVEKKPLYHFRPGTRILSAGFAGCNLHCPFCQNWHISQSTGSPGRFYSPGELVRAAKQTAAIAYTYSEPLVHIEFLLDCMKEATREGVTNVLVSNGCVNAEAAGEILNETNAVNIDLKCFSRETYKNILGGDLEAVKNFILLAAERKVHVEITTLIVPGLNDSREELDKCRDFIAEIESGGTQIPWHLSAYHPSYKYQAPPTDTDFILAAARRAAEKLPFVYTGNIVPERTDENFRDTRCPACGKILVGRRSYRADISGLLPDERDGKTKYLCAFCGKEAPVKY